MPAHKKYLDDLVRDGTFRRRDHEHFLDGPLVDDPDLATLQAEYQAEPSDLARQRLGLQFQAAVRDRARVRRHDAGDRLAGLLAELGPAGSAEQAINLFPRFFRHTQGPRAGQRFELEPWQQHFIRDFHERDREKRRRYTVGLWGVARGCGKTPTAAGLDLHTLLWPTDSPEVYGLAGSKEQASIGLEFASTWVETSELAEFVQIKAWTLRCPTNRGIYRVLSSDGRLGHGLRPSRGRADELWLFEHYREVQSWIAMKTALHKRDYADLLAITTAGYDKTSLLGEMYDAALRLDDVEVLHDGYLTIARDPESGFLMHWWAAPEDADIENIEVIRRATPASWLDPRDILRQLHQPGTDELEWRRLHLNQFTKARDSWLPSGIWAGLRSDTQIPDGAGICVGIDVGLVHDSTAVVWAARVGDRIVIRSEVFTPERMEDGVVDLGEVEHFIAGLAGSYRVTEVVYDPRFFENSAQRLARMGFVVAPLHQSSAPMADAYQSFYAACKEGVVAHDGDKTLTAHVEATAADLTERGWKVRKLRASARIDACVAAVMAVYRALQPSPEPFAFR